MSARLILLGPPGSGKSTQAKILANSLGIQSIASGDLFRSHQLKGTRLGLKAKEYMSQGLLVPDEITIAMVLENIKALSPRDQYLLDGFPRNLVQAHALSDNGQEIDKVLLIQVPREELVRRLSGRLVCTQCQSPYDQHAFPPETPGRCDSCGSELYQRPDDTPEAVRVRIQVYEDETEPLIELYGGPGKLERVEGVGTVQEVAQRLLKSVQD